MPPAINPYRDWLGLAEAHTAPHHYRLLGLRLFEDDARAITGAAARWTSMLTAFLSGPHRSEAQRVLKEIDLARQCLLGPESKRQYDDQLRNELRSEPARPAHFSAPGGLLPPTAFPASTPSRGASPSAPGIPELPAALSPSSFASQPPTAGSPPAMPPPTTYPGSGSYPPPTYPAAPPPSSFGGPPAAVPWAAPSTPYSQPGAYAQPGQYSQPNQYSQPGSYAPPAPYAPPVPSAQPSSGSPSYPQASYAPSGPVPQAIGIYPPGGAAPPMPPGSYVPTAVPFTQSSAAMPQAVPVYPAATAPSATFTPSIEPYSQLGGDLNSSGSATVTAAPQRGRQTQSSSLALYIGLPVAVVASIGIALYVANRDGLLENRAGQKPGRQVADASAGVKDWGIRKAPSNTNRDALKPPKPFERPEVMPENPPATSEDMVKPPATPTLPEAKPLPPVTPPATVSPTPPKPTPTPTPTPPTPAPPKANGAETIAKALAAARAALAKQDIRTAKAQIEIARKAEADEKAAREIERVDALTQYVEGFWKGVRESVRGLEVGGQINLNGAVVAVVEVDAQRLTLRMNGANRKFSMSDLPLDIAFGLADNWLDKTNPSSKIALGSIHVVHPNGDRGQARRLWQLAAVEGKADEVAVVMPELDGPTTVAMLVDNDPKVGADGKLIPPGAAALSKARAEVKQLFEADFAAAQDQAARQALAVQMLARANGTGDSAPLKFALLGEAGQLSAAAGNFEQMASALDRREELFGGNALEAKADALLEAAKTAGTPEANKALATFALGLSDEAVLLDKVDQAGKLVRIALGAARKANDPELLKACSARDKEVKELKKT